MKRIYAIRFLHFILVLIFVLCIDLVYYFGITNTFGLIAYPASAILFLEAVALILNRGNCPLEHVHRRAGDGQRFFDHFFPEPVVPWVIPVVVVICAIGFLLLYLG